MSSAIQFVLRKPKSVALGELHSTTSRASVLLGNQNPDLLQYELSIFVVKLSSWQQSREGMETLQCLVSGDRPRVQTQDAMSQRDLAFLSASRSIFGLDQGIAPPTMTLRDEPQVGQQGAEWQGPEPEARSLLQQLWSSLQNDRASEPIISENHLRRLAPARKPDMHSLLNSSEPYGSALLLCHYGSTSATG